MLRGLREHVRAAQAPVVERLVRVVGGRSARRWVRRLELVPVSFWRRRARRPKIWPEHWRVQPRLVDGKLPPLAGGSAIEAKAAGGKWNEGTTWEGGVAPTQTDDVILSATSGTVTISGAVARCRSLDALNYKKTLKQENSLQVGAGSSNGGLCLRFGAGMTYTNTGFSLGFVSTSGTVEKVTTNGIKMAGVSFESIGGKWELQDKLETSGEIKLGSTCELKTGGVRIIGVALNVGGGSATVLNIAGSQITLSKTSGEPWKVEGATVFESTAGSIIELTGAGATAKKFLGAGKTYAGTIIIAADNCEILNSNTIGQLTINNAGGANGTKFEKGTVQTITTGFSTNGKAGSLVKLLSTEAGKAWKLKKTGGTVEADFLELKDSAAEGTASWFAGTHSTNVSGNSGWKFEAASKPVEIPLQVASSESGSSLGLTAPTRVALQTASSESSALSAFTAPTQVPVQAAASSSAASAVLSAPTGIPLQAAHSDSTDSLAVSARTAVALDAAASASAASLQASASTQIPLNIASAVSAASLAPSALAQVQLQAATSQSASSAALSAFTEVPLDPATSASAASALVQARTEVPLDAALSGSVASLALTAKTAIPLGAATSDSAASLQLGSPTIVPLAAASSASSAGLDLSVRVPVALQAAASASSATLGLGVRTPLALQSAASDSVSSLDVRTRAQVVLQAASSSSDAALELRAPTEVLLQSASSASVGSLVLSAPTEILLQPAIASSGATLHISIPLAPGYASTVLTVVFPAKTTLGSLADASTSIATLADAATTVEASFPASTTVEEKADADSDLLPT